MRSSQFGPSFVFENSRTMIDECILKNISNRIFNKYQKRSGAHGAHSAWNNIKQFGEANWELNSFPFDESRNATIEINVFPYDNAPKFKRERYYNLANENNFHYIIIQMLSTSKGDSFLKIEPERIARPILVRRREVIQEIVKEWIKYLHPFFVWGDNFPIIKKYEPEDSRSRVWGYNYYSEALVQLIGAEKFTDLLLKTNDWYLEYVDNGILLIGDSDPYSMNGKLKNKAKSILKLDKQLAKVIKSKQLVSIDNREAPPKGVIE